MPTAEELKMLQALPLEVKVMKTKQRIREWVNEFGEDGCYVSFSGGKDSQVLTHIVKSLYPNIPIVFINTGLEYDSVRKKGIEMADEVLRPQIDFATVIKEKGYPFISKEISDAVSLAQRGFKSGYDKLNGVDKNGNPSDFRKNYHKWKFLIEAPFRLSDECCWINKKAPAKIYEHKTNRKPFLATMAEESSFRKTSWILNGCNAFNSKRPISQPMSFWQEQDVLKYIKQNNLVLASVYKDIVYVDDDGMEYDNELFNESMQLQTTGADRTGCVYCGFGCHLNNDKRFLELKEIEPVKYDYVMRGGKFDEYGMWIPDKGLGYKFVIDWLNEHGNLGIRY